MCCIFGEPHSLLRWEGANESLKFLCLPLYFLAASTCVLSLRSGDHAGDAKAEGGMEA